MEGFTAYIFKEDCDKLTKEAIRTRGGGGGSLFGQWTSTGNPVVHFVTTGPQDEGTARSLYNSYRLCHIGEWRTVTHSAGNDARARKDLLSKYRKQGRAATPSRFVVLDVYSTGIEPFLFTKQATQMTEERGKPDVLEGQNPFNLAARNTQYTVINNAPAGHQSAATSQVRGSQLRPSRSHSQEAETRSYQWYSTEGENKALQFVYKEFENISRTRHVEMSRDTQSHDMSMSFTDQYSGRKWEVKFPSNFPRGGAILVETSISTITGRESIVKHRQPDQNEPGRQDNLQKAVERMIRFIKQRH